MNDLTLKEVSKETGISTGTLRRAALAGTLEAHRERLGGFVVWFVTRKALDEYVAGFGLGPRKKKDNEHDDEQIA